MAVDPTAINNSIASNIVTNNSGKITAGVLSSVLFAIVAWVVANFVGIGTLQLYDPLAYGAYCDGGTHDDYAGFLAAQSAAQAATGGAVRVPATGKACVLSHGIVLANGVGLVGAGGSLFPGATATIAQWTAAGSWIQSTDTANPTVTLLGNGSFLRDVNFIRSQPIPSATPATAYTPTTYPYEISVQSVFSRVDNVKIVAAYNGVEINIPNGGGTYNHFAHLAIDAMNVAFHTYNVNDVIYGEDIQAEQIFYSSNSNLVAWRETNAIGWLMEYTDNIQFKGFQCYQLWKCIKTTNGTIPAFPSNTHAGYNVQIGQIQCNLVAVCIDSASATLSGQLDMIQAQGDTAFGLTATLFNLAQDKIDLTIGELTVNTTGGSVMNLGGGAAGSVKIGSLTLGTKITGSTINGYSTVAAGQTAFAVNAGAQLSIAQRRVLRATNAGAFISGAGAENVQTPTFCWQPFGSFGQASLAGNGSAQSLSTDHYARTSHWGNFLQVRIDANPNVSVATAGSYSIASSSFPTDMAGTSKACTGSTSATGFVACNLGWFEVNDSGVLVNRLTASSPTGSTLQFGTVTFCGR